MLRRSPLAPFTILLLISQSLLYVKFMKKAMSGFTFPPESASLLLVAWGLLFTLFAGECCARICHRGRPWGRWVLWGILGIHIVAGFYHIRVGAYFDLAIFIYNKSALTSPAEVLYVLSSIFQLSDFFVIPLILAALSRGHLGAFSGNTVSLTALAGTLALFSLVLTPRLTDEWGHLLQKNFRMLLGVSPAAFVLASGAEAGVSYARAFASGHEKPEISPDVFLILVESFNPNFVDHKEQGRPVTPFFNSLIPQGVYVERFYGNSMQTAKGHVASLCSVVPSIRGKIMEQYPETRLRCLPEILRTEGYQTVFYQAQYDIHYDNTGPFFAKNGFELVRAMDGEMLEGVDEDVLWNPWGLQEDVFFEKVFEDLEKKRDGTRPLFCALATITNHMGFTGLPEKEMRVVEKPENLRENYMNSLAATDAWLRIFFEKLKKRSGGRQALVVITGDHGFPMGEAGTFSPQVGFGESNFRTPLLLLWPERLAPRRIRERPFTQVDIAPTILDLLGVSGVWPLMGTSVFQDADPHRTQVLVQPYNGQFFVVLKGHMKYVYSAELQKEYFFDLKADPEALENRIEDLAPEALALFRKAVGDLYRHQDAIADNRICPLPPEPEEDWKGMGKTFWMGMDGTL